LILERKGKVVARAHVQIAVKPFWNKAVSLKCSMTEARELRPSTAAAPATLLNTIKETVVCAVKANAGQHRLMPGSHVLIESVL
jgi:hypothetical protein